jgi:hypothetical protein
MEGGPSCQTKQKELYQQTGQIADTYMVEETPPFCSAIFFLFGQTQLDWSSALFSLFPKRWVKRGGKHVYVCVYRIDIALYYYIDTFGVL